MTQKKLAFIDHSFHRRSTATAFLIELLQERYQVDIYWDDTWQSGTQIAPDSLIAQGYDTILFFQQIRPYSPALMTRLGAPNIILVPMHDQSHAWSDLFWLKYHRFKILAFSQAQDRKARALGLNSRYFQFFLPPAQTSLQTPPAGLHGFFWQRTNRITWKQIRILIGPQRFDSFQLHLAVDPPGFPVILPSESEKNRHTMRLTGWHDQRDEYIRALDEATVFFAPRLREGIGMSFLEALARGMLVVAPDSPTMNEYISHGVNGLLYNPNDPQALDFSNIDKIRENDRLYSADGYRRWQAAKPALLDFIEAPSPGHRRIPRKTIMKAVASCAAGLPGRAACRLFRIST